MHTSDLRPDRGAHRARPAPFGSAPEGGTAVDLGRGRGEDLRCSPRGPPWTETVGIATPPNVHRPPMPQKHSRPVAGGRAVWYTERLWRLARDLPVTRVAVADVPEFDRDCWFGPGAAPTCRAVALHARRIVAADLAYPIILAADGGLMDGGHRIAKAWLLGHAHVRAVRFPTDPEPDYMVPERA